MVTQGQKAGMQPLRADEEISSGMIHKEMFERLLLSDVAVVDISALNANVYYELGIRHAVRKKATVVIGAGEFEPPFDIAPLRISRYSISAGLPDKAREDSEKLSQVISRASSDKVVDSPVFQLLDLPSPDISRLRTDTFREKSNYDVLIKERFAKARKEGREAVLDLIQSLGDDLSVALASEALLSLRAASGWEEMIRLSDRVSPEIALSPMFIEQKALALSRSGKYEEASALLENLIKKEGATSERCGILGGVFKRQWLKESDPLLRDIHLEKAMSAYLDGFYADWRDAYPGINFLTLSFISGKERGRAEKIKPLVLFDIERRLSLDPDFWDRAAMSEMAAVQGEKNAPANPAHLMRESWEGESAAGGLSRIQRARESRSLEKLEWVDSYIESLRARAKQLS